MRRLNKGFTLVELLVVIAIIGILSAIAIPGYNDYMRKTYRAEAKGVMSDIAQKEERYFTANAAYLLSSNAAYTSATWPNFSGGSTFAGRKYDISVTQATAADFTITATPTAPHTDPACNVLTLTSAGVKNATGTLGTACW